MCYLHRFVVSDFFNLHWCTVLIMSLIVTLSRVRIFHFHLRKWKSTGSLQLKSDPLGRLAQEPPLLPRSLLCWWLIKSRTVWGNRRIVAKTSKSRRNNIPWCLSYLGFIKAECVPKFNSLSTKLKFTSIWGEGGVCETAGRARVGFARIAQRGFAWSYSLLWPKFTWKLSNQQINFALVFRIQFRTSGEGSNQNVVLAYKQNRLSRLLR